MIKSKKKTIYTFICDKCSEEWRVSMSLKKATKLLRGMGWTIGKKKVMCALCLYPEEKTRKVIEEIMGHQQEHTLNEKSNSSKNKEESNTHMYS